MIEPSSKIILHLCAKEGSDSICYRDRGYDVRIIGEDIGVENYHPPENVYGIIANPPCTHFSIVRTTAKTPRDLREGMRLVKECLRIIWECQYDYRMDMRSNLKFWMIENPATGILKQFLGNPVFQYSQQEYNGISTKRTALWGMFNLPKRPILFNQLPTGSTLGEKNEAIFHDKSSGNMRDMQVRSRCPIKFAETFFEANP